MTEEIERILEARVIKPAQSEWTSPVVIASKYEGSYRFCNDYRKLTDMKIRDTYPLPSIGDTIDSRGDATLSSIPEENGGYMLVSMSPKDREKIVHQPCRNLCASFACLSTY